MAPLTRLRPALLATAAVFLTTLGCSSTAPSNVTASSNAPEWITRPNGLYEEGGQRAIYAWGVAAYNPNPAAQVNMARTRARAELARTLQVVVQGLVKDYMSTNRDFYDMDAASSVEYYEDISRQVTDEVLIGSRQINTYRDPIDNNYYVYMRLDFDDVIANYKAEMNKAYERETQRKRIKASADDFEKELDEQLDKLHDMETDEANQVLGL